MIEVMLSFADWMYDPIEEVQSHTKTRSNSGVPFFSIVVIVFV